MTRGERWLEFDRLKRLHFLQVECKKQIYRSLGNTSQSPITSRRLANYLIARLPRYSSATYSTKRCVISGRRYSTKTKFGLSRFVLRDKIAHGTFTALRRASW